MSLPRSFRPVVLLAIVVLFNTLPAGAQAPGGRPHRSLFAVSGTDASGPGGGFLLQRQDASGVASSAHAAPLREASRAPRGVLPALYAGLGTLQALDTHSTLRAVSLGLEEQNPMMRWASSHPVALVALKAAATTGTIVVAERIRRKHPKRAIAFIAAVNAGYAFVVIHNYRTLGRTK